MIRQVAIETSGRYGSICALECEGTDAQVVHARELPKDLRTAQSLVPALASMLQEIEWEPKSVELVATVIGPGSFTGLRIGVTAAKTFAYAVGADIVGINTMDALAEQVPEGDFPLWTVLDAQRNELFAAKYNLPDGGDPVAVIETHIAAIARWIGSLHEGDTVTGPVISRLAEQLPPVVRTADQTLWYPSAVSVGRLAWRRAAHGNRDDLWQLVPNYYRPSAAEETAVSGRQ